MFGGFSTALLMLTYLDIPSHWQTRASTTLAVCCPGMIICVIRLTVQVLLEAPFNPRQRQRNSVLLTIDLTKAVADEAIRRKDSVIVAYRTQSPYPGISRPHLNQLILFQTPLSSAA